MESISKLKDYEYASSLVDKPNSCMNKVTHIMRMRLPCEYMFDFMTPTIATLDDKMGSYDVELEGIPVAYNKNTVKLVDPFLEIVGVETDIRIQIQCDVIVFNPSIHSTLEGIVNTVTSYIIGCLVHGCFYASIHRITPMDINKKLKIGDTVQFHVAKLEDNASGVLSIIGSLHGHSVQPSQDKHIVMSPNIRKHRPTKRRRRRPKRKLISKTYGRNICRMKIHSGHP